jgi:CarD family transcriptional regulator
MKFKVGDTVVHPVHGAGTVIDMKERRSLGTGRRYYSIALVSQPNTLVMVAVQSADNVGLRHCIPRSKVKQILHVLRGPPSLLPSDHEERYELLKRKLHGGDVLQVAEAVRDLASRQEERRRLTEQGKRLYEEGLLLLAGEIAAAEGSDLSVAQRAVSQTLQEGLAHAP